MSEQEHACDECCAMPDGTSQRMTALAKANQVRLAIAAERARIKQLPPHQSRQAVARLLLNPPPHIHTQAILDVLLWARSMPRRAALAAIRRVDASESRQVGQLSSRQRREIAGVVASGVGPALWATVDVDGVVRDLELGVSMARDAA